MHTNAHKRAIVEETLVPGASVAAIARKHGVNANLLFGWRRLYQQGLLEACREPAVKLLAVEVSTPVVTANQRSGFTRTADRHVAATAAPIPSHIEVESPAGVRVRVVGVVDPEALRTVLSALLAR